MTKKIEFIDSSGNFFEDVGFEKQEAKKLQFKSYLMVSLMKYIKSSGLTQIDAGKRLAIACKRATGLQWSTIGLQPTT